MENLQEIAATVKEYAQWSEFPEFWDGIYRRIKAGVGLSRKEIIALNDLVADLTEYKQFTYTAYTM